MMEFKANSFQILTHDTLEPIYVDDNIDGLVETEIEPSSLSQEVLTFNHEATFEAEMIDCSPLLSYTTDMFNKPLYMEYKIPVMVQARWHKKPRINKKWLKRYGMKKDEILVRCNIISMDTDYECENPYEIEHHFNLGSMEYKFRPDQLRRNLKLEAI